MLQVSTFAGLVLRMVRPSASFVTVFEPPFCSICVCVKASTWHAEHTAILAEVAIGLPTVVGIGSFFGQSGHERRRLHGGVDDRVVAGADMAGVAAIELARIDDIREVVDRAAETINDERRARGAANAAVMDRVDHVLEVDRLLPQAVDPSRGQCLPHAHIGGRRVVAGDADLCVVVAVRAVQGEHAVADIALGDVHDHAPRERVRRRRGLRS